MHSGCGESVKFAAVDRIGDGCCLDSCTEFLNFKVDDGDKGDRASNLPQAKACLL
jgi:hypothetical protein